jgi:hypothetical protein
MALSESDWGDPLVYDTLNEVGDPVADIASVDAHYDGNFTYFRFTMDDYIYNDTIGYAVIIDFDSNKSTGSQYGGYDIGLDLVIYVYIEHCTCPDLVAYMYVDKWEGSWWNYLFYAYYNATAENNTAFEWSEYSARVWSYFDYTNMSNGQITMGINWSYITSAMWLNGYRGDNCTIRMIYETEIDYCPDQTEATNNYIEWNLCTDPSPGAATGLHPGWIALAAGVILFLLGLLFTYAIRLPGDLMYLGWILIIVGVLVVFGGMVALVV